MPLRKHEYWQNCQLPTHPEYGKFIYFGKYGKLPYRSGYHVPPNSTIRLTCNRGFNSTSPNATQFYCSNNGQWIPHPGECRYIPLRSRYDISFGSILGINPVNIILIITVAICFVAALVALILYQLKFKKEREIRRELKLAGVERFQNGDLKLFNPELGIDDQAGLLPYNNNFEFPRNKLKFGKKLGSGEFGVVIKADAFGLISNEEKTTVAVKTIKSFTNHIQLKALISELKILVHLGQHLNVINLLGACTKNIAKGELFVIVEYCSFGNVQNYLRCNRNNYVNQIDSVTGNINYSLVREDLTPNNASSSQESFLQHSSFLNSTRSSEHNANNIQSGRTNPIYTKDIIAWSFQIARGMDYLASRKVLHGDLAARNILLAENNIVKVCDFGLAKKMYKCINYTKQKNCPLPIKWMAIESIRDRVFSTQSDVWSYGIVLWELFSFAETPYPNIEVGQELYNKLMNGYKMESPPYAPNRMYQAMCDCWNVNPELRPSFNELAVRVGLMLESNIRQNFIDLNDPYIVNNTQRINENRPDYLEMLSAPSFQQLSIPRNYISTFGITADDSIRNSGYISVAPTFVAIDDSVYVLHNEDVPLIQNE